MKKKPILYLIYFLILIVGFVVIVLVRPLFNNNSSKNTDSKTSEVSTTNNNSVSNDNSSQDNKTQTDSTIYATELTLNIPNRIYVAKNQKVKLLSGFYSVSPQNITTNVEINILSHYNSDITKVTFQNNEFMSSATGLYKLKITVKSSAKSELKQETIFEVIDEDQNISKKDIQLLETKTYAISSLFTVKNTTANLSFSTDNLLEYDSLEKVFTATNHGQTTISATFTEFYTEFDYTFTFDIKQKFNYQIVVYNIDKGSYNPETNTITINLNTNENFRITFKYFNLDTEQLAPQIPALDLTATEDNIVEITKYDNVQIKLLYDYLESNSKEITLNIISTDSDINVESTSIKIIFSKP